MSVDETCIDTDAFLEPKQRDAVISCLYTVHVCAILLFIYLMFVIRLKIAFSAIVGLTSAQSYLLAYWTAYGPGTWQKRSTLSIFAIILMTLLLCPFGGPILLIVIVPIYVFLSLIMLFSRHRLGRIHVPLEDREKADDRPFQFSIFHILVLTTTAAILTAIYSQLTKNMQLFILLTLAVEVIVAIEYLVLGSIAAWAVMREDGIRPRLFLGACATTPLILLNRFLNAYFGIGFLIGFETILCYLFVCVTLLVLRHCGYRWIQTSRA